MRNRAVRFPLSERLRMRSPWTKPRANINCLYLKSVIHMTHLSAEHRKCGPRYRNRGRDLVESRVEIYATTLLRNITAEEVISSVPVFLRLRQMNLMHPCTAEQSYYMDIRLYFLADCYFSHQILTIPT